jgi:ubiquinone/menaquinone biosynthesis C-methylase UbiE
VLCASTSSVWPRNVAGLQDLDTGPAHAYEERLVPGFLGPSASRVIDLADAREGEAVLDVACGTGIGLRLAARRARRLTRAEGVDLDPAMLAVAARAAELDGLAAEWHCASALELPLPERAFNLCLCLQGLQFFPDPAAALAEIRRVLRPGGRVVVSCWGPPVASVGHDALFRALERQGVDATKSSRGFSLGDQDILQHWVREAGFARVTASIVESPASFASVEDFVAANAAGSVASRFALAGLAPDHRERLLHDMQERLAPYTTQARALAWNVRAIVVRGST